MEDEDGMRRVQRRKKRGRTGKKEEEMDTGGPAFERVDENQSQNESESE